MNTDRTDKGLGKFRENFRAFLKNEFDENGMAMIKEVTYRFAMVQFRNTEGFEPSRIHYIPKVLSDMQIGFGEIFEGFEEFCFESNINTVEMNRILKEWLIEILEEINREYQD